MELKQQLAELRAALESLERRVAELEAGVAAESEQAVGRRRWPRRQGLMRVDYGTGEAFYSAIATNIGEGGMCFETSRRHEVGAELEVAFELPGAERPLKMKGAIIWVNVFDGEAGTTKYEVGIHFLSVEPAGQRAIRQFVASLPAEMRSVPFSDEERAQWLAKMRDAGL